MEQAMHGEYKTPGGKLVIVDFEVKERHLQKVQVSGDFFLYPDEALDAITGALEGMSAELRETEIARVVSEAIPSGTEVLGTSPEAIAIAVQRAIRDAVEGSH